MTASVVAVAEPLPPQHRPAAMTSRPEAAKESDPFPLSLDLAGRTVALIGGGTVATRRAAAFVAGGATLRVISPVLSAELRAVLRESDEWLPRPYIDGDLDGVWLAHTATGDRHVDAQVAAEAEQRRIFCINAGNRRAGSAAVPARASSRIPGGSVHIAVTSADPRRSVAIARHMQQEIETGRAPLRACRTPRPGAAA